LQITSPTVVRASFILHPLRLPGGVAIFVIETDIGKFFAQQPPTVFDKHGMPVVLPAEIGIGSVLRVAVAGGLMRAVQIVQAHLFDPFSGET
jgi:hypothetical protein